MSTILAAEPTTERRHRLDDVAAHFRVSHRAVWWWASRWYRRCGAGNGPLLVSDVDVMALRALYVLTLASRDDDRAGDWDRNRAVAATVRADPRRWLIVAGDVIATYDTAEAAAQRWLDTGQPAAQIIDLWSVPEPAGV